jgi:hypothetical protein
MSKASSPQSQEADMSTADTARSRRFLDKNLGPVDRMVRAIIGVIIMAVGLLWFDAQKTNGVGLIFMLVGFLVFLEAPMSWSPVWALKRRSTYEKDS